MLGQTVTLFPKRSDDHLAVQNVHLTADGFDVQEFLRGWHLRFQFDGNQPAYWLGETETLST